MEALAIKFQEVESKWYGLLLNHIEKLYTNQHLPSHDVGHHQRVWEFVKEILNEIHKAGRAYNEQIIVQAIVASFFHDTGLLFDNSEKHGYKSRQLCEQFFKENPNLKLIGLGEVLNAIEHHDDKSLKSTKDFETRPHTVELLPLISAADDLDAFGLVGVYRYWEIYSLRGVPRNDIPQKVIVNLNNRFQNFKVSFSYLENFVKQQECRYLQTANFYIELMNSEDNNNHTNKITELFDNLLINQRFTIVKLIQYVLEGECDQVVKTYFLGLRDELDR